MSDLDKPSRAEDEYFAREEIQRRKKWATERANSMQQDERDKLKTAHWMKCPKCGMDLQTVELQGVKIDNCASCGGSWLDAGELEQLSSPGKGDLFQKVMSVFR